MSEEWRLIARVAKSCFESHSYELDLESII